MNYYISDLHLFDKSQLNTSEKNYDNRPFKSLEEMHDTILTKWNEKVTNGDIVYILGDISNKKRNEELISLVARLKGQKYLIKGNHDDVSDYRNNRLFENICDYKEVTDSIDGKTYKLVLSHYPILMWNGQHRGYILLYGHTHQTVEESFFQNCLKRMNSRTDILHNNESEFRAINVGSMGPMVKYEPRSLKELLETR